MAFIELTSKKEERIMKKPHDYTVLSDRKCSRCGKPLKLNPVERKARHNMRYCYACYHYLKWESPAIA